MHFVPELKYNIIILVFGGRWHPLISYAHAEHKFLMRMLRLHINVRVLCISLRIFLKFL
jgi:hypothetical protein